MLHIPSGIHAILLNILFDIIFFLVYRGLICRFHSDRVHFSLARGLKTSLFTAVTNEPAVSADYEQLSPRGHYDNFQNNSYLKCICSFRGNYFLFKKKHIFVVRPQRIRQMR